MSRSWRQTAVDKDVEIALILFATYISILMDEIVATTGLLRSHISNKFAPFELPVAAEYW